MSLSFGRVSPDNFEALADLRVESMRESLERVGRFDPHRARERLRKSFAPEATFWIEWSGERVGFYALRETDEALVLDHLYLRPAKQGRGVGSAVLRRLFARADRDGRPIRVTALRGSPSNGFYRRHGFVLVSEEAFDLHYVRPPVRTAARP